MTMGFDVERVILDDAPVPGLDDAIITEHQIQTRITPHLVAVTVDGVPTSQNHPDAVNELVLVEITTLTAPGTLRLTGTSVSAVDGSVSPADTEDIVIGVTGWHSSSKLWIGTVVLSSVGGLDAVMNTFNCIPVPLIEDFTLQLVRVAWNSSGAVNSMRLLVEKFVPITGFVTVVDVTEAAIPSGENGHILRSQLNVFFQASAGQRLVVSLFTQRVVDCRLTFRGF